MKAFLNYSTILPALAISMILHFALPASADSTANLLLNLQCEGGYNVDIWKTKQSGELLYRSTSSNGKLSLGRGTSQATEGVRVYKFQKGNHQYLVWDGTLDSQQSGTLEVYKNNTIQRRYACTKR
ncbi:hypothetical protein [Dulcicalothrix desertica]|uniref:hypothetical protein n=1 Tax=Dulcicalothrix desertica TaxID=32056 RepID=UPI000F8F2109|nr:hypothetical protein [Dulcicalothrix desertica]TWH43951.1 hypothetical protein CAL7102_07709 [Dulcicalothrix desertica PCC 7102]